MIELAIILFAVLAIFHFLYENCILPELRQHSEYRLFEIRDELRDLKYRGDTSDNRVYEVLQQSINNAINVAPVADFLFLTEVRHAEKSNPSLKKRIDTRTNILQNDSNPETRRIRKKLRRELLYTSLAGMGCWYPYLFPIALTAVLFSRIKTTLKSILALPADSMLQSKNRLRLCH